VDPTTGTESATHDPAFRAGYAALFGEPNAGKSTFLNAALGEKVAIVSPKPQTTRDRIVGICPVTGGQLVFVDTPGVHHHLRSKLNAAMVSQAFGTLLDVHVVMLVVDASRRAARRGEGLTHSEQGLVEAIRHARKPAVLLLNKIDKVEKAKLLPIIDAWRQAYDFEAVFPVSALNGDGVRQAVEVVAKLLPLSPPLYPEDQLTDRPLRFLAAEIVREKLFLELEAELPYVTAVEVEQWEEDERRAVIHVAVHIEKSSQKRIVVGAGGERIKSVGVAARPEIEALVGKPVFLQTFVHVEEDWSSRDRTLKRFGYVPDAKGLELAKRQATRPVSAAKREQES
jgi:GTP-binding protein Era